MDRGYFSKGIMPTHDVHLAVGSGKFPGVFNSNVSQLIDSPPSNNTEVDFTDSGVTNYVFPAFAGEPMTIQSDNAADVTIMQLIGINELGEWVNTTVQLNGLTPVPIGNFSRVNLIRSLFAGAHQGVVTVTGNGNTYLVSNPENQRSFSAVFSTPEGFSSKILGLNGTLARPGGNADAVATIFLFLAPSNGGVRTREAVFGLSRRGNTNPKFQNFIPEAVNGRFDYTYRCEADSNNVKLFARTAFLMERII